MKISFISYVDWRTINSTYILQECFVIRLSCTYASSGIDLIKSHKHFCLLEVLKCYLYVDLICLSKHTKLGGNLREFVYLCVGM